MDNQFPDRIQFLKIEDLFYDPKNPRLPASLVKGEDENEVINWMLSDAAILELMGSIGEKGFFPAEPLLVVRGEKGEGKYEVVEGNRRLTAVKLLKHPELAAKRKNAINLIVKEAKFKPDELPVFIFSERRQILDYLGFKHITGVKPWSALAKAKYLKDLQVEYKDSSIGEQYKNLAKAIGSRSDYVRDLLVGLQLYEKISEFDYFDIDGLNEDTIEFGVYYTALGRSNIPQFLGIDRNSETPILNLNESHLKEFTEWVSQKNDQNITRLGESRNLTKLSQVVLNDKALSAFREGKSLDESLMFTEEPDKLFQVSILESLNKINTANLYFHRVQMPLKSDYENLKEINSISDNLSVLITKKLAEKR